MIKFGQLVGITLLYVCQASTFEDEQQDALKRHQTDFNNIDENKDKWIDPTEVRTFFPEFTGMDVSAFFIAVDSNEDGLIDFNEFHEASTTFESGNLDLNDFRHY